MTTDTETVLLKLLEEIKAEFKETNKRLNSIEVNQAKLEVEVKYIREDTLELKTIYKWVITLIVTLNVGLGAVLLRFFDLFFKA